MSGAASADEYRRQLNEHVPGTVYLLHFNPAYQHAKHYIGWTGGLPEDRLAIHLNGGGSPLVRAVVAAGGTVTIARLWEGVDRHFERALKNHGASRLCPVCTEHPREPKSAPRCAREEN